MTQRPYCKTCGLFDPCPTCSKGRAALSIAPDHAVLMKVARHVYIRAFGDQEEFNDSDEKLVREWVTEALKLK